MVRVERLTGNWSFFDELRDELYFNGVRLWSSSTEAGYQISDGRGGKPLDQRYYDRRSIKVIFDMIQIMRAQQYANRPVLPRFKPPVGEAGKAMKPCPDCDGVGMVDLEGWQTCPRCKGARRIGL